MSVSKLESLPNEILADLLEKYINGIDILNAFAFQLNRRFNALISQSHRLCFDFMKCHKDHFRVCVGLLPVYIDKIEELALSEQDTPGQIHAFLCFFPSFSLFTQLRKLYLHINTEAIERTVLETALDSLWKTNLDTLSIKITKASITYSLSYHIGRIFRMKTLKKFSIFCEPFGMNWVLLKDVPSSIQYLTIDGLSCEFEDLKYIFRCTSDLKYLNIKLTSVDLVNDKKSKSSAENAIIRMPMLHTVIFKIPKHDETTPNMLQAYLRVMPSLRRLEIKTQNGFHGLSIWETLLKTSLPTLTYFNLESNVFPLNGVDVNVLESVQTLFWIEKRNFNIVIKKLARSDIDQLNFYDRQNFSQYESNNPVDQWWIGPRRKLNDNLSAMNSISSLNLSTKSSSLLQGHYLDNVKHLVVHEFNDNLLELLTTHVNCSQIKHLDLSFLNKKNNRISKLLACTRSIISVRINLNQLVDYEFAHFRECKSVKFVDISVEEHRFKEKYILTIGKMFPHLEHLAINTQDLRNVPLLKTYLPHLRSLTFTTVEPNNRSLDSDYQRKMADENLRQKTQFLFQRRGNWITVWIDEATLQDSYWQTINRNSNQPDDDSWFNKLVGKVSSAFN